MSSLHLQYQNCVSKLSVSAMLISLKKLLIAYVKQNKTEAES